MKWGRHISHWMDKLDQELELPKEFRLSRSRVMYIEAKSEGLEGPAVIGRVYFSKSGKTIYYKGLSFQSLKGAGFKANYFDIESGDQYWISGPRKDQNDRLYGGNLGVLIDDDVREEYEALISKQEN
ncbi:MAG: 1-deoxy-D-xylulose-5-phosphate synthase [Paracoccaceae bacterium]